MITVRTQLELQQGHEYLVRDAKNKRWTDDEFYRALNQALQDWAGRVRYPLVYTITTGWVRTSYEYTLPDYIQYQIQPQQRRWTDEFSYIPSTDDTWTDMFNWEIEPNASGGRTLRLDYLPYSGDGRILYWTENGPAPISLPTLNATINSTDTSLTLASKPTIARTGYIKIDSEWLSYAGATEGASTLTLTNLTRGLMGTTAASHSNGATVYWGVAADDPGLFQQLSDNTIHYLMRYWLLNTSSREAGQYEKQMVFYQDNAQRFWRRYAPSRPPKLKLSLQGVGAWW